MQINIRSLIEGLSYALDAAEKSYFSHSKHVAYLSVLIANELHFEPEEIENLYYAALLHDIGASNTYLIEDHCIVGKEIVLTLPINPIIANYIHYHHEYYDGTGPFHLNGHDIPLSAQIICISDLFEKRFGSRTTLNIDLLTEMKGWIKENRELFYPNITEHLLLLLEREYILLDYYSLEFNKILVQRVGALGKIVGYEEIELFAQAFSKIIDNRSPFTYEHSRGIEELVSKITSMLGYNLDTQRKMRIAALLHDIGKLVVSKEVIEKPGSLNQEERFEINKHTYYTRWILEQIEGFEEITKYAANHHEKLNGRGYPLHLEASQLGELERIMAICDIYQALTEDRPYRVRMSEERVWFIIEDMVAKNELDQELSAKIKVILNKGGNEL